MGPQAHLHDDGLLAWPAHGMLEGCGVCYVRSCHHLAWRPAHAYTPVVNQKPLVACRFGFEAPLHEGEAEGHEAERQPEGA